MINRVTLIGNLGQDPEVRTLESGTQVAKFSVATNENYKDSEGNWQKKTEWHNIVAWRRWAEYAENNLKKGTMIFIEGKLTHRKYQDQQGIDRYVTEVVANYMRMIPKGTSQGQGSGYFPNEENAPTNVQKETPADTSATTTSEVAEDTETASDDLPF